MRQLNHYETMDKMTGTSTELVLILCGLTAENSGLILRTADVFSVSKVFYVHGQHELNCATVRKVSRNAHVSVVYIDDAIPTIQSLREEGYEITSLEITDEAIPLRLYRFREKTCLIIGNERNGVPQDLLDVSDKSCYIEMTGGGISSLNVSVSTAIAVNRYVEQIIPHR